MTSHPASPDLTTMVTLVDDHDQVLGMADKLTAHQGKGLRHRAASVFLFRKNSHGVVEVLLQQRSALKIVAPNLWANTACGNCRPGEEPLVCIQRRLREELGVTGVKLTSIAQFTYQVDCEPGWCENEFDHFFAGWYDGKLQPNPQEVQNTAWIAWPRLLVDLKAISQERPLAPWVEIFLNVLQLRTNLAQWLKETQPHG